MNDIKIVQLSTGHHLIAKVSEIRTEKDEPICFLLAVPMTLSYGPETSEENVSIKYAKWSPFSSSLEFRIGFDQVITISDPIQSILEKYVELVNPYYPIISTEQSTTETTEETE